MWIFVENELGTFWILDTVSFQDRRDQDQALRVQQRWDWHIQPEWKDEHPKYLGWIS